MAISDHSRFNLVGNTDTLMDDLCVKCVGTLTYDEDGTKALITVQDGDVVLKVWVEKTAGWDGDGTVTLGDGADPDGYATDVKLAKGFVGYGLINADDLGAYLWDAVNGHKIDKIYAGADTIDAVIVTGTSTQGAMSVYALVLRLK